MKRFITGVLLVALSCLPSLAQAAVTRPAPVASAGETPVTSPVEAAQPDVSPGSALDYAAREAAAPQLRAFAGGGGGLYIGSGALVLTLLVVIIVLLVR